MAGFVLSRLENPSGYRDPEIVRPVGQVARRGIPAVFGQRASLDKVYPAVDITITARFSLPAACE
jgi:hypothetical protein